MREAKGAETPAGVRSEERTRVLLIEDDPVDTRLVGRQLRGGSRSEAFELKHAKTTERGLELLDATKIDVVLLDLGLADGEGTSALRAFRSAAPGVPIVVLTGVDDDDLGALAVRDGAQDYLVKGKVTATSLRRCIRYAIERKSSERLRERLHRADRLASIGQLAAGVAHEVNNPAAFLLANTSLLQDHAAWLERMVKSLPDALQPQIGQAGAHALSVYLREHHVLDRLHEQREMLSDNLDGLHRIQSIVRALGSFSRIDKDEVQWVDINDIVRDACALTRNETRHRATVETQLGAVPYVAAHQARLSQVLVNLLVNAAHAIEEGTSATNKILVTTRFVEATSELVIEVEDTGGGIRPEHLDRLFEPFFTTKPRGHGTGLGLSLCLDTIRAHSGHVDVESEVGVGTRFSLRLPEDTGLVPQAMDQPASAGAEPTAPSRGRVLVVDDEAPLRRALERVLKRHHEVVLRESADQALRLLDEDQGFDVILCDLMMPEIDGAEFYQELSLRHSKLVGRTLFISGGAVTTRIQNFVSSPGVTVLDKPINRDELLAAVRGVMTRSPGALSEFP